MLSGLVNGVVERVRKYKEAHKPNLDRSMSSGLLYLQLKRPEIAEYEFREAIALNPQNSEAWFLYGLSIHEQDRLGIERLNGESLEHLISIYHRVIELEPIAKNYYNLALVFHDLCLHHMENFFMYNAINANPDDDLLIRIGRVSETLGQKIFTERVKTELAKRDLAVHIYPL